MNKKITFTMRDIVIFCVMLLFIISSCSTVEKVQAPEWKVGSLERPTTEGIVIGQEDGATNTISWKAIPYAQPPVEDLRWKAPELPQKRSTSLQAKNACDLCPQYTDHDSNPQTPPVIMGDENCLYLNITSPKSAIGNLPVFFWIHGGGNSTQSPLLNNYDFGVLSNRGNMVIVAPAYRLGVMGFFNHPALKTGDEIADSGNFAILDLIAALKWVQANIRSFGGDPQNVTIGGESAGGLNVYSLVVSPMATGLFHRAISESAGGLKFAPPELGAAHMNQTIAKLLVKDGKAREINEAAAVLSNMSAKNIEIYLRSKTAREFLEMYPEATRLFGMYNLPNPFGDGKVLPVDLYSNLKSGEYNKVPMILGTNKEEMKLFLPSFPPFAEWIKDKTLFADPAKLEFYNLVDKYQTASWKEMAVDFPAKLMRGHTDQPSLYAYEFFWGAGGAKNDVIRPPFNILFGACHAMELGFVFGSETISGINRLVFNDENRPGRVSLSNAMMDYWAAFARTGNPNVKQSGLPIWSPWVNEKNQPKLILFDADREKAKISMCNTELSLEDIEAALKSEPRYEELRQAWERRPIRR